METELVTNREPRGEIAPSFPFASINFREHFRGDEREHRAAAAEKDQRNRE